VIQNEQHAIAVQKRRVERGLNGYAKAVRRYMKRNNAFFIRNDLPTLPRWRQET
jgi:hypothetical protein